MDGCVRDQRAFCPLPDNRCSIAHVVVRQAICQTNLVFLLTRFSANRKNTDCQCDSHGFCTLRSADWKKFERCFTLRKREIAPIPHISRVTPQTM
jgi:hypothetical protein